MNISKEVKPLRVFCILIIYAFLGWWNTLSLVAHHQDDWHRRFREEAPKAWRQIAETARKVQGSLHYISMRDSQVLSEYKWQFRQVNGHAWIYRESLRQDGQSVHYVDFGAVNERYAFALSRSGAGRGWFLVGLTHPEKAPDLGPADPTKVAKWLCASYIPYWVGIHEDLAHPNFTIFSVRPELAGDDTRLKVEFRHQLHLRRGAQGDTLTKEGWLILNPSRQWTIEEGEIVVIEHPSKIRARLAYGETKEGFPALESIVTQSETPEGRFMTIRYLQFWLQPVPSLEEFYLPHYGLSEPEEFSQPRPWWLYLSLMGLSLVVMGLILGAYLHWRRVRRAYLDAKAHLA